MGWGEATRPNRPLDEARLGEITGESEVVGRVVASRDGLTRIDGADERNVDITVIMVVTDHRILFLSGAGAAASGASEAGSLAYDDIAAAGVRDGVLDISTVDGPRWRFPLADAAPDVGDAVARHLGWIGAVRRRVVACGNNVELAVGEIREATASRDWESAVASYERARRTLDDAIEAVQLTAPIPDVVLAPELTERERSLEAATARMAIERGDSRLTLGQQLVDNDEHERARTVVKSARADYDRARSHAAAVRRGDGFVFGQERELADRLERLEWELEAVAAEPLRLAHEAKVRARSATDHEATVEQWETAFERYSAVLKLEEGDGERHFAGDLAAVREECSNAAGRLIAIRQALARNEWDAGVECHREDDTIGAILRLDAAVEHFERAYEIAEESRPEAAASMADRLEQMREGRHRLRESGGAGHPTTGEASGADPHSGDNVADDGPDGDSPAGITAQELAELDTHHDITFTDDAMMRNGGGASTPGEDADVPDEVDAAEDPWVVPGRDGDGGD